VSDDLIMSQLAVHSANDVHSKLTEEVTAEENQAADETHQSQRSILQERDPEASSDEE
jgi:hypothetical protein